MRNSKIVAVCGAIALALAATGALAAPREGRALRLGAARHVHGKQAPDALLRALRSDRLSRAEYSLQRARSLFHLNKVREQFGHVARPGPRDATMILRDLALSYRHLSGEDREAAGAILARPTDGASDPAEDGYQPGTTVATTCSANFCFHWVTTTSDAVATTDANTNSIPDYIDTAISVFEQVRSVETGAPMSMRAPLSDESSPNNGGDGKTDIYFTDTGDEGTYGYCTSDDPALDNPSAGVFAVSAYCTLDNDFREEQFDTGTSGTAALQVTAAHEYFHAIQYAYDIAEDKWLLEGSAVWAEDVVYDDINDYVQYLQVSQMAIPSVPLDFSGTGDRPIDQTKYGAFLFFRYLSDAVLGTPAEPDHAYMRGIFEHADSTNGAANDEYSTQAVESVLDERGVDFTAAYARFGVANLFPTDFYQEGADYDVNTPGRSFTLTRSSPSATATVKNMDHLTHSYRAFRPGTGARSSSKLRVAFNGPPAATGTAGTVLVLTGSGVTQRPFAVNAAGDETLKVAFGRNEVSAVVVIMTNAGRAFDCFRGQRFSCQGRPHHDDLKYSVTAKLLR